ncbi:hypothetical protein EN860_025530 [Mesorhizobium sp. M00.F.Ca.ET.217.01.1.1]|nr:hypothetical protein EN860_025530 [Mesorhizobium sp. M00.F.Ca.ET.217.01.1.1]TGV87161.1 hypothetical protein EN801_026470 [Mesorhizobium sp. M00.F.Ca.ET.158.01.1.1]
MEKRAAHVAVYRAIRSGKLTRGCCEVCGSEKNVDAHHAVEIDSEAYSKPLDSIVWLCRSHHRRLHSRLRKQGGAA